MEDQSSEITTELLFLLGGSNPNWERIQYLFGQLLAIDFSLVPAQLIQKLGIYYIQNLDRAEVMAHLDADVVKTCLLSHQAHGYSLPNLLAEALEKWNKSQPMVESPFPKPIAWSTSAVMQIDSAASMDSPIIYVWVYNDDKGIPVEIIICGRGIGWIREQVDNAVLATALHLSAKSADVLLEGLTCLRLTPEEVAQSVSSEDKQTLFTAQSILTGGNIQTLGSLREDLSPADAMKELIAELTQLESKTGLVEVTKRPYVLRSEYQQSINAKTKEYRSEGVTLWQHTAEDGGRIAMPFPFPRLNINLPFSLIESTDFKMLHDLYRNDIIRAAASDALRRLNFYVTNLNEHADSLKTYLDPSKRSSLPESVQLELQIDYETGLTFHLKDPTEQTRDEYYGKHVPALIKMDINWIRKIKKLLFSLSYSISQPDSNLNRLTVARLFDAALRDIPLTTSSVVENEFTEWKKKVQPLLWYLWDNKLTSFKLKRDQFASRQQFFMLDLDVSERLITLRPFALVDTKTTLFVFDSRYPVPLPSSLYDRLIEHDFRPQAEKAHQYLTNWRNNLINGKAADAQESLKAALAQDPEVTVKEIISSYQKPFMPISVFEKEAAKTKQKIYPILAHNAAIRLWVHNAAISAYAVLQEALIQIQREPLDSRLHKIADIPLALAWFKALALFGKDIPAHLKRLRHGFAGNNAEKEIQRYLHLAAQLDSSHLARCLDKRDLLFTKTLKELRTLNHLSVLEQSMFNVLRALAFVQAAQDISQGVEVLDVSGESPRSIYAKVAPSIDGIWSNLYIQDVSDQVDGLINMLLGYEVV